MASLKEMTAERLAELLPRDCFEQLEDSRDVALLRKVGICKFDWMDKWKKRYRMPVNPVFWLMLEFLNVYENMLPMVDGFSHYYCYMDVEHKRFEETFGVKVTVEELRYPAIGWVVRGINASDSVVRDVPPLGMMVKWMCNCIYYDICSSYEFLYWWSVARKTCVSGPDMRGYRP